MEHVAEGLEWIPLVGKHTINAYLVGDVIVDAGTPRSPKKLLEALAGRDVKAHAITHAHTDHVGGSKELTETLGIPMWVPENDADQVREGRITAASAFLKPFTKINSVEVARDLKAGDELAAGFIAIDTPGHSPGEMSFWRESDRTLIAGDVFVNMNILTTRPGLHNPPGLFTADKERNHQSQRELAALEPDVVVFGHGPPLYDAAAKLAAFVS
jgi:glyoxylase-like metal-dependent hydrolase (beta-lactamase superfamily II)